MRLSFTVATPDVKDKKILALRGDFEKNLQALAGFGYHGVELMVRDVGKLDPIQIKNTCEQSGLEISAVSSGQLTFEDGFVLSSTDEEWRQKSVEATKAVVHFTEKAGCDIVNIGTLRGKLPVDLSEKEIANLAMVKSMNEVLDYSLAKNIKIAFEPQCRYVVNWHNSTFETFQWMQQFLQPNFFLLFDVYHSMIEDLSLSASIIKYASKMAHIQVSDSNRLAPGKGQWNYIEIVRLLKAVSYNGYISVEVLQKPSGLEAAKNAAGFLLPILEEEGFM